MNCDTIISYFSYYFPYYDAPEYSIPIFFLLFFIFHTSFQGVNLTETGAGRHKSASYEQRDDCGQYLGRYLGLGELLLYLESPVWGLGKSWAGVAWLHED